MGKVFLSYSRDDSLEFTRELHRRLVQDGVECFFDEASIEWGDNFVLALENGLNESDHVIVILSPGFVRKEWAALEHTAFSIDDPANLKRTFLPLLHRPCEPPRFLKSIQYLDVTTDELLDERYPIIRQTLADSSLNETASTEGDLLEWPESPPSIDWPIADHGDVYTAFGMLLTRSSTQRLLTISGPSGSGKSLITSQMLANALEMPDLACGLFNFKGTTGLDTEIGAFIRFLDIPFPSVGRVLNEKFTIILEDLKNNPRPTLLIFDTYESVGEAKNWVEGQLLTFLVRNPWLRVAISGQIVPEYSGTIWQHISFPPFILENPRPDDWFKYSQQYRDDLTLEDVRSVCELSNSSSLLAQIFGPQV